ncbi:MAG: DUF3888 domain-containing protein [Acetatifactor sp.]|nr:DUF3888 domain-containing protein [Acetatifactor sp.]
MRKILVTAALLVILFVFLLGVFWKEKQNSVETFSVDAVTEDEIKDELIIAVFISSITKYVNNFYSEFYTGEIAVYNYETDILEVEKTNGLISIRFGVTPQIGAHNPLGYDELLYSIDSLEKEQLTEYEHIKDYTIPERFEKWLK